MQTLVTKWMTEQHARRARALVATRHGEHAHARVQTFYPGRFGEVRRVLARVRGERGGVIVARHCLALELGAGVFDDARRARDVDMRAKTRGGVFFAVLRCLAIVMCVEAPRSAMGASSATRKRFIEKSFPSRADASRTTPRVRTVEPSLVHVAGGASVVVSGAGFDERVVECKFAHARAGAEKIARATTTTSSARVTCVTPSFVEHGAVQGEYAQVFARNGVAGTWSGTRGNFHRQSERARARNTFATLRLDASAPGCYGCFASSVAVGSRARETWTVVSDGGASAGPMDGGTTVRVRATNLANASPGTFYPGELFSCGVFCASASGGWKFARGTARWLAYDVAECETPPWPGTGADATTCLLRFANDGTTYDDLVASGGDGDGTGVGIMTNAAKVDYAYASLAPTVTTISVAKTPATSRYGARGRVAGGAEVVVAGSNFLPSAHLACGFIDAHGTVEVPATYVSSTEIRCVSPSRLDVVDPETAEIDYGTGAPCIVSKLRASNTEIDARVNSWSTDNGDATSFHFCDLYVSASGGSVSRADGSSTRPFARIQDAFDVAADGDVVRIGPGVYFGPGNVRLMPPFIDSTVRVVATTSSVIDCEDEHPLFAVSGANPALLGGALVTRCGPKLDKPYTEFTETCESFPNDQLACRRSE